MVSVFPFQGNKNTASFNPFTSSVNYFEPWTIPLESGVQVKPFLAVLLRGTICNSVFYKTKIGILLEF